MAVSINKIQFLTNKGSGNPIFYCHGADDGHYPSLSASVSGNYIAVSTQDDLLFKVKKNPQKKDRVDIYMSVQAANALGQEILALTGMISPKPWSASNANPQAAAGGRMMLPGILSAYNSKAVLAKAITESGVSMSKSNCYVNIDEEMPHSTHIKMKGKEVHIGVALNPSVGTHDATAGVEVNVPASELQKGTGETNPIQKVRGFFTLELDKQVAAGLGQLLIGII
ncbi:hypothetical protein NHH63_15040 [Xanthomonas campestris pv. campestris]|uniref:hypothetical protein n=1 Tax=Xanthomonas campestris TaxID=339 RepID=UPI00265C1147|nr:hypothetical protein [Xanthomonas campestris]MDO0839076.1 hypothetical protein [Xanthomonas campestris pv. campestris]